MPKSQLSWVRSQRPPTQWISGAADEAVLNKVLEKSNKNPLLETGEEREFPVLTVHKYSSVLGSWTGVYPVQYNQ